LIRSTSTAGVSIAHANRFDVLVVEECEDDSPSQDQSQAENLKTLMPLPSEKKKGAFSSTLKKGKEPLCEIPTKESTTTIDNHDLHDLCYDGWESVHLPKNPIPIPSPAPLIPRLPNELIDQIINNLGDNPCSLGRLALSAKVFYPRTTHHLQKFDRDEGYCQARSCYASSQGRRPKAYWVHRVQFPDAIDEDDWQEYELCNTCDRACSTRKRSQGGQLLSRTKMERIPPKAIIVEQTKESPKPTPIISEILPTPPVIQSRKDDTVMTESPTVNLPLSEAHI